MSIAPNLLYVGQSGAFTLASPFNTIYNLNNDVLSISGILSIGQLLANNVNIMDVYFKPYGLSQTLYTDFLNANGVIVNLQNSGGTIYPVPSTYISAPPDPNGYLYRYMGLNIVLGPLKTDYPMTTLITNLSSIVESLVGITPGITPVELSNTQLVSVAESNQIEAIRTANITGFDTIEYYQNQLNVAQQQISALENFIKTNFGTSAQAALINVGTTTTGTVS